MTDQYIFDIIKNGDSPERQKQRLINHIRFVNQHLKSLCLKLNLPVISTYWARHSYATVSIRNGAPIELIQENLGHGNLKTTMNYFAGFEDDAKRKLADKLLEF